MSIVALPLKENKEKWEKSRGLLLTVRNSSIIPTSMASQYSIRVILIRSKQLVAVITRLEHQKMLTDINIFIVTHLKKKNRNLNKTAYLSLIVLVKKKPYTTLNSAHFT